MNVRFTLLALTALTGLTWSGAVNAQQTECGTDDVHRQLLQENPGLAEFEAQAERDLQDLLQTKRAQRDGEDTVTYYIPVVFHILHNPYYGPNPAAGSDAHNISDAQCLSALNILNRDFRKDNADTSLLFNNWGDMASKINIQFRLATKDPFGNCTNGINRITTLRSNAAGDFSKLEPWQRNRYLNVWVVQSIGSGAAGYSNYPSSVADAIGGLRDGVEILHNYFGFITGGTTGSDGASRALTHEVGHWLNLSHVWGDSNGEAGAEGTPYMSTSCGDDSVLDTPRTKGHRDCNATRHNDLSCSNYPLNVLYRFTNVTPTTGVNDPTPVPLVTDTTYADSANGAIMTAFRAVGVSNQPVESGTFGFTGWDTGATDGLTVYSELTGSINTGKYYRFIITPEPRYAFSLDSVSFKVRRSATGPRTYAVRVGNFATNVLGGIRPINTALQAVTTGNSTVFFIRNDIDTTVGGSYANFTNSNIFQQNTPAEIRIYAWNAEDADGAFVVDDVRLHGKFGITENIQNYMEYSYCSGHMFTPGQRERMRAAAESDLSGRSNLWTAENHAFTGIRGFETECAPSSDFYPIQKFVCLNTPVQMRDNSENFPTSWAWEFPGGTPSTSNLQHPVVEYQEHGAHPVTLTTSNASGTNTVTKNEVVWVAPPFGDTDPFLNEGFNAGLDWKWPVNNYERNQTYWQWTDAVGHYGPGAIRLNSASTYGAVTQDMFNSPGASFVDRDELLSPALDLRFASNLQLTFWYAYATSTPTTANILEGLTTSYSTNCGRSWFQIPATTLDELTGAPLVTAGVAPGTWAPQSGDWRQVTINLPSNAATLGVRIRLSFTTSMFANDIYLDDFQITGNTVGMEEYAQSGFLGLMPNPTDGQLGIELDMAGAQKGTLSFFDATGRQVHVQGVSSNDKRLNLNVRDLGLSSGVYLVRLSHTMGQRTERLVIR